MLRGGEWIRRVKINAHSCSDRKQPRPQLCTTGGGGAVWYLEQSEALSLRQEGSAGCRFFECAFFLTTPDPLTFSDDNLRGSRSSRSCPRASAFFIAEVV